MFEIIKKVGSNGCFAISKSTLRLVHIKNAVIIADCFYRTEVYRC